MVGIASVRARSVVLPSVSAYAVLGCKTGTGYYVVRLVPKDIAFKRGSSVYPLRPGVQVMAAILTGERSVLAVLLEPFVGSGVKPLTER